MNRTPALLGAALLLSCLIVATGLTAALYHPPISAPTHVTKTIIAKKPSNTITTTTSVTTSSNVTELAVTMTFPNGSSFQSGVLYAGALASNVSNSQYLFQKITPGIYPLSLKETSDVYLPPTNVELSSGLNYVNITVYELSTYVLYFDNGVEINGTQPGPSIFAQNASAVELSIINNTTLIHDLGVVSILGNESASNVLFNSLSVALNAGGSTNDTFIVSSPGAYYYEDLIGSHALDGDYGYFIVNSS